MKLLILVPVLAVLLAGVLQWEFRRLERERTLRRLTRSMQEDFERFARGLADRLLPAMRHAAAAVAELVTAFEPFAQAELRRGHVYFRGGCPYPLIDPVYEPKGGAR